MLLGNRDGSEDRQGRKEDETHDELKRRVEERSKVWGAGVEARKLEGKGRRQSAAECRGGVRGGSEGNTNPEECMRRLWDRRGICTRNGRSSDSD